MMRERYESIPMIDLKEMAKNRGIKGVSAMKKAEVVQAMLDKDQEEARATAERSAVEPAASVVKSAEEPVTIEGAKAETATAERSAVEKTMVERSAVETVSAENPMMGRVSLDKSVPDIKVTIKKMPIERDEKSKSTEERISEAKSSTEGAAERASVKVSENTPERPMEALSSLDSGQMARGILEVMQDGYGFIRSDNFMPGENDVYVAPSQIRRFGLKTGDILEGNIRIKTEKERFGALLYVTTINGLPPQIATKRYNFEDMTPIFPNERINLETPNAPVSMRIMNLFSPVGKGQRGMIVSPPKAGKTTLLKEVAKAIKKSNPDMHMIILLIDERPEEVTDMKEEVAGSNVEVIYSTFDELPEHHKRVSEMVIERARRLVEYQKDVIILLDSITRLTRAYNQVVPPSGRTLSGGLDPAALHMPKRFFGAARNMREGGSLTILATALVDTGSKMDDVVYEEFKGTGNMEMVLDRKLSERRVFPAIDIPKSGTRREDLLLRPEELEAMNMIRKSMNGLRPEEAVDRVLDIFAKTRTNAEFVQMVKKTHFFF